MINIYHIYWGTSGSSGLYLDEIYQVLKKEGYNQRVFVNYYYPFDYGDKIFFKRGDVAMSKYKGLARKMFQLIEVIIGYLRIIIVSIKDKPNVINYSHVGQSYFFIVWFLKVLKKVSRAKLMITCHDVNPHFASSGEMINRCKIFHTADYLLVHNDNSIKELYELFNIDVARIVKHPFPIMDLSKKIKDNKPIVKDTDFLFIGHLRKDKGAEFLLNAWKDFYDINKEVSLKVCGRKFADSEFDENELAKYNIEFNLRFIDDYEYYHYVKSARYVILPYIQGTNSGIISTVLALGTHVITSNIPMFKENPLVPDDCMFESENRISLVQKLQEKWLIKDSTQRSQLAAYKESFRKGVVETYSTLLK